MTLRLSYIDPSGIAQAAKTHSVARSASKEGVSQSCLYRALHSDSPFMPLWPAYIPRTRKTESP